MPKKFSLVATFILISIAIFFGFTNKKLSEENFISYVSDPKKQDLKLYWKNENHENFKSILNLKTWVEKKNKSLIFAMNAGMYKKDNSPQGLFIENYKTLSNLDPAEGSGNFYLKPNGIFFITKNNDAMISTTENFKVSKNVKYATQSGPMLVIDGKIHTAFNEKSANLNIRNGVGILPDDTILFAMSKEPINFYDFADYFKSKGCKNALYLDGLVSRTYLPEKKWLQKDGNFGVIIGVISK